MAEDAAQAIEPFRNYLLLLADLHLDRRLRGKLDSADIVQQVVMRACIAFNELRSKEPEVLAAWLRKILAHTLADAVKHYERDRRDIRLELSLAQELDKSAAGFASWLAADQTSPSQHAERNEDLLRLVDALSQLPVTMREVVVRKHCQGQSLAEIAQALDKTVPSVASLLRRGLEELRKRMTSSET